MIEPPHKCRLWKYTEACHGTRLIFTRKPPTILLSWFGAAKLEENDGFERISGSEGKIVAFRDLRVFSQAKIGNFSQSLPDVHAISTISEATNKFPMEFIAIS